MTIGFEIEAVRYWCVGSPSVTTDAGTPSAKRTTAALTFGTGHVRTSWSDVRSVDPCIRVQASPDDCSDSATWNARSRLWRPFRRGSHTVW